jgi:hypothetical protein
VKGIKKERRTDMAISIFDNKFVKPQDADLPGVLDKSNLLWEDLKDFLEREYYPILEEWKFYGSSTGWGLLVKNVNKTILYLYPSRNYFTVLFVFGEKAVEAVAVSPLPKDLINKVQEAKRHTEGRSFYIDVRNQYDLEVIKQLIQIKIKN